MASLYKQSASTFWWLKWRNPKSGRVERFSTKRDWRDERQTREAIQIRAEYSLREAQFAAVNHDHPFHEWVMDYLLTQHQASPRTRQRYRTTWLTLQLFLDAQGILTPAQVKREHCHAFLRWRMELAHLNGRKPISHNTALLELKLLVKLMQEACNRGYIEANPCLHLRIRKAQPAPRDEMTPEQEQIILDEINRKAREPMARPEIVEFLKTSFEIARFQGVRLSETHFPLGHVNLARNEITILAKGGEYFTAPLNPRLRPLFERLIAEGRTQTYQKPRMPSLVWFKFFERLRRKHPGFERVSFHSTRVSVISRIERAGAPETLCMKIVNHASTSVHRHYRKVRSDELAKYWDSV